MTDTTVQQRALQLFSAMLELPESDQEAFLDRACAGEPLVRQQVLRMLRADSSPSGLSEDDVRSFLSGQFEQPQINQSVHRSYRVLRVVGQGSSGTVYEAEQDHPRRRVAIKAMHVAVQSPHVRKRFEREARILQHLHHPGIARLLDSDLRDEDGLVRPYLVMEYIDGLPLDRYLLEHQLDRAARVELFLRLCQPIAYAHSVGVVHRDLKPANVLIDRDAQPRIVDFGVACTLPELSLTLAQQAGQIVGTLAYMSPEQLDGARTIDARSDVYSLGIILYEMLTNTFPIDLTGLSVFSAIRRLSIEQPVPPSQRSPELAVFDPIIARATAVDLGERYASTADLVAAVRGVQAL